MHGSTCGHMRHMRMLVPASTTSSVNPTHRSSGANPHIATPSALVPWRTFLQQQPPHQPIAVQAARTTQADTTDAAPKKKRAPRKKKDASTEGDVPKQRKAARPIKRTDADAAFLQLLPEDTLEQLQHQLQGEMEAMVERKGGGLLTKNKKRAAQAEEEDVANVQDNDTRGRVGKDVQEAVTNVDPDLLGTDHRDGGTFEADATPQWYGIRVSENYGKRVGTWIEDTVRIRMPTARLADGREVERPCKTWIPEKTIQAYNHSTGKMGSKKLQYQQGGVVLLKTVMDRELASVLESSTFTHGWLNQDMQSVSESLDGNRSGRARRRGGGAQVVTLPKACTRQFMNSIDTWLELQEDETEEEAKEERYGGLPGPISRPSTRIEDQEGRVEVYTVDDGSGGQRKVVKYKSDAYRGTYNNPSRWFDPSAASNDGAWQGSAGDDDEEFSLSLVTYDPPRRGKRDQEQRRAKHIQQDYYHGPDEGFVGATAHPDATPKHRTPGKQSGDASRMDDRATDRRTGTHDEDTSIPEERDEGVEDAAWEDGWGHWNAPEPTLQPTAVDNAPWGGLATPEADSAAVFGAGSTAEQGAVDDVDALLEELQFAFSDVPTAPAAPGGSSSEDEDWGWFLAELDSGAEAAPSAQTPSASIDASSALDGLDLALPRDSQGQDDWLDALFAEPEAEADPAPRRRMRAGVELDNNAMSSSTRERRGRERTFRAVQEPAGPAPPGLPEGAPVEVTEGPWRGFTGKVLGGTGRQRVALQLDVFGKLTEAEVDLAHCRGL